MIRIEKTFPDKDSIVIQVQGKIDEEGLAPLKEVCLQVLETNKKISLHLDALTSVDRSGKEYLREIQEQITLVGLPEYLRLELL